MSWCLDQQLEVVRRVLEASKALASSNQVASLSLLSFASERLPKLVLIALGSLRCSDLAKARSDLDEYVVKMVRKALRTISKEVCSIDAARIVESFGLTGEKRSFVERALSNASARARTSMQKKLAPLYEELIKRLESLRQPLASLDEQNLVSRGLEIAAAKAREILDKGFLSSDEVSKVIEVATEVLSNEIEKACRRIATKIEARTIDVKRVLESRDEVKQRVSKAINRAIKLLNSFVASTLIMYVVTKLTSLVLTPTQPSQVSDPRRISISGIAAACDVLASCASLIA